VPVWEREAEGSRTQNTAHRRPAVALRAMAGRQERSGPLPPARVRVRGSQWPVDDFPSQARHCRSRLQAATGSRGGLRSLREASSPGLRERQRVKRLSDAISLTPYLNGESEAIPLHGNCADSSAPSKRLLQIVGHVQASRLRPHSTPSGLSAARHISRADRVSRADPLAPMHRKGSVPRWAEAPVHAPGPVRVRPASEHVLSRGRSHRERRSA